MPLVILINFVILSLWRSIHKFKVQSCALKVWILRLLQRLNMTMMCRLCKWIFFAAATPCNPLGRYAQNDKVSPSLRASKASVAIHKFNANLPLDCHEFTRLRFANSRNDKTLVILTCLAIPNTLCVILSDSEVSIN